MSSKSVAVRGARSKNTYLQLVRRFPLRPIRTAAEYARAGDILEDLFAGAGSGLTSDESDYADVLGRLVREYDERHSSILLKRAAGRKPTPVDVLKYLLEEHGMNTTSLGSLVGGSGQASLILSGKRELSKANIRTLAARFNVSPALFI
jgi:HTH-type transcriptional regulator / antitoxin HigA